MRKTAIALILISGLLITAIAGTFLVILGKANPNPMPTEVEVPPPVIPTITFLSPENNTLHGINNLTVSFKSVIKLETATVGINQVYYTTSWRTDSNTVYVWSGVEPYLTEYSNNLNLTGVPEGDQTVTVTVRAEGYYYRGSLGRAYFFSNASSTIAFTVDTTPPTVSVLELENKKTVESEVPLNFAINEPVSKISYVLDEQENVTIAENTTLSGLPIGAHNVTVYAWDAAGNVGASETISFTVAESESFPTVPVAAVSAASIAAVAGGLLLIRKRRKEATHS